MAQDKTLMLIQQPGSDTYTVNYNGVTVGSIFPAEDGCQVFWPDIRGGFWESWFLRTVADRLDQLNKAWDDKIQNDPTIYG